MNAIKTRLKELKLVSDKETQRLTAKTHKAALQVLKTSVSFTEAEIKQIARDV